MKHLYGWLLLGLLSFLQPPGQVAADTKLDLVVDPGRFLARALHVWTDDFPLGQMQNQAYGYLFPQGAFFWLTDPLPDWVAQRLWWWLLLGVAYSGMLVLSRGSVLAAALYALSPRILTTLTAISSEAWPVALVPWTLVPLVSKRPNVAAAALPVFLMGAVNATATIAACAPAFIYLLARRKFKDSLVFAALAAAVSAWWIGPLFILGRYSPPFTDFIESASVTTAWLNPVEILRGTTSWAPFVDTERVAGHLLVAEPVFILATCLVAAIGLTRIPREFQVMLAVGFILLASAHWLIPLYDAPLAPFRNLHKFDPLIRVPLCLGVGYALEKASKPQLVGITLVAAIAVAPAWSLRLLPQGTWTEIPPEWIHTVAEADALDTRTLVVPPRSFAREDWGWTRDEPIQALSTGRFAFRDAIPLVEPEAIRGLEGQTTVVDPEALRSIGVGAVLDRRDLTVTAIEPGRDMMFTQDTPLKVDAGGEALPLLWRELGYFPVQITGNDPDLITDTPALSARNYGTLHGQGAHQAFPGEDSSVSNRVQDYPSAGTRVGVSVEGTSHASSSAADAGAFPQPQPDKSLTSAFDANPDTAWWPAPEDAEPYLFIDAAAPYTVTATATTQVTLSDGTATKQVTLVAGEPRTIAPEFRWIHLTEPVGISDISAGISRIVEVEGTADAYFFQREFPGTTDIRRRFTTSESKRWALSAPATINGETYTAEAFLPAGTHDLVTDAETILIGTVHPPTWEPFTGQSGGILLTTRGFNDGLRASLGGTPLAPLRIDASAQAFHIPPGAHGEFVMRHEADNLYRGWLAFGGAFSLLVAAGCLWVPWRRTAPHQSSGRSWAPLAAAAVLNPPAALLAWAVARYTLIKPAWLSFGALAFAGLWLARAPWPSANYAGDSWLLAFAGCLAVAAVSTSSKDMYATAVDTTAVNSHTKRTCPEKSGTPSTGNAK